MNHIQVVYSLIEMNEPGEAMTYMDKLYGDMQRVSRMMRTACPAVNAHSGEGGRGETARRGLKLSIAAKWDDPLMPA
ncbi:MAG: Spo0B domain-containing protein [Christensenellales bacterium]